MDNEVDLHFHNAKREVDHSYWNSLLTLNGILISVFSAFSFFATDFKILLFLIVIISIYACWLIINNFKLSQTAYDKVGFSSDDKRFTKMTETELNNFIRSNLQEATNFHKRITKNENIVHKLFYFQMFFIIVLLFINLIK